MRCQGAGALFLFVVGCCGAGSAELPTCTPVDDFVGAEDVDVIDGLVIVSAFDRRTDEERARGDLWAFDPKRGSAPRKLTAGFPYAFRPHGIGIWPAAAGRPARIFVVNHRAPCDSCVEVFDWHGIDAPSPLTHIATVRDAAGRMTSPNDVAPDSASSFYVTNSQRWSGAIGGLFEQIVPRGTLLHCRRVELGAQQLDVAADELEFANGVAVSHDGKHVFVGESAGKRLRQYRSAPTGGKCVPESALDVCFLPDNLTLESEDTLIIAGHPCGGAFLVNDWWGFRSGSVIVRMSAIKAFPGVTFDPILVDREAERISASSSCVRDPSDPHRLFVGTVYEGVTRVDLDSEAKP